MSKLQRVVLLASLGAALYGLSSALKLKHTARKTNFVPKQLDETVLFKPNNQQGENE
jgi:hypothetical protein